MLDFETGNDAEKHLILQQPCSLQAYQNDMTAVLKKKVVSLQKLQDFMLMKVPEILYGYTLAPHR